MQRTVCLLAALVPSVAACAPAAPPRPEPVGTSLPDARSAEAKAPHAGALRDRRGEILSADGSGPTPTSLRPWVAALESTAAAPPSTPAAPVTLDAALHRELEAAFATVEVGSGAVIDTDGRVRALFSTLPHHPAPHLAARHRATGHPGPCGSAGKPITALAAFAAGVLHDHTRHTCTGTLTAGARMFRCAGAHGEVDLTRALAVSDNVFFFELALAMPHDHLADVQHELGLGEPLSLLPDAPLGWVPHAAYFEGDGGTLDIGQTLSQSIGHGLRVTPLQLARAYAALASGVVPALSFTTAAPGTPLDEAWSEHLHRIRAALRHAVTDADGTAHFEGEPTPDLTGKTGTADAPHVDGSAHIQHGWFAGWAPADAPRIAFAFRAEGMTGREVARRVIATLAAAAQPVAP